MDMKVSPVLKFNEVGWRRTAGVAMRNCSLRSEGMPTYLPMRGVDKASADSPEAHVWRFDFDPM
jgi:hypothetical protein